MTIAVSLPLILVAFFVNDIGDYLARLKFPRASRNAPAHERHEEDSQTTLDHDKRNIQKKGQDGLKSLIRKRTTKQGDLEG